MGSFFLLLAIVLAIGAFLNTQEVLGINSLIKPFKFALSTSIYAYSFGYLFYYLENQKAVKRFSILAIVVMLYENGVIVVQALRGTRSHFNQLTIVDGILYAVMGIMIVWVTIATLVITIRFIIQKTYSIPQPFVVAIQIALIVFVIFSFFGGYMSKINTHTVGGEMGGSGLPFFNWSNLLGDLRVAHFFGIHALQLIPFFGFAISKQVSDTKKATLYVWLFSIVYIYFVCFTAYQALSAQPFIAY
jgi:hypothetical protein